MTIVEQLCLYETLVNAHTYSQEGRARKRRERDELQADRDDEPASKDAKLSTDAGPGQWNSGEGMDQGETLFRGSCPSPTHLIRTPLQPTSVEYRQSIELGSVASTPGTSAQQVSSDLNNDEKILNFLRRNFRKLKDDLEPRAVAQTLITKRVLSVEDLKSITQKRTRKERAVAFLLILADSPQLSRRETKQMLEDAFMRANYSELIQGLDTEAVCQDYKWPREEPLSNIEISRRFNKYKIPIEGMISEDIIDAFLEEGILSFNDYKRLMRTLRIPDKMSIIKECVLREGTSYLAFCEVLRRSTDHVLRTISNEMLHGNPLSRVATPPLEENLALQVQICNGVETILLDNSDTDSDDNDDHEDRVDMTLHFTGDDARENEQMVVDDAQGEINSETRNQYNNGDHYMVDDSTTNAGAFSIKDCTFSCVKIKLRSMTKQSAMTLIQRIQENPMCIQSLLEKLIKPSHRRKLQKSKCKKIAFSVQVKWPKENTRRCFCRIKQEHIVKHFTTLEVEMKDFGKILDTFCDFDKSFAQIRNIPELGAQKESFLRKLHSKEGVQLCLFERELRNTEQIDLLKKITSERKAIARNPLTKRDISSNSELLCDELEPRNFIQFLQEQNCPEHTIDKIVSGTTRRNRCKIFLQYIGTHCTRRKQIRAFELELERQDQHHVLEMILKKTDAGQFEIDIPRMHEAILESYNILLDTVDPIQFKTTYVARALFKARSFDKQFKIEPRRERASHFLRFLTKIPINASNIECFLDSLKATGQADILNLLTSRADEWMTCPSLYRYDNNHKSCVLEGEFDVRFVTGIPSRSLTTPSFDRRLGINKIQQINKFEWTKAWAHTGVLTEEFTRAKSRASTCLLERYKHLQSSEPSSSGVSTLKEKDSLSLTETRCEKSVSGDNGLDCDSICNESQAETVKGGTQDFGNNAPISEDITTGNSIVDQDLNEGECSDGDQMPSTDDVSLPSLLLFDALTPFGSGSDMMRSSMYEDISEPGSPNPDQPSKHIVSNAFVSGVPVHIDAPTDVPGSISFSDTHVSIDISMVGYKPF